MFHVHLRLSEPCHEKICLQGFRPGTYTENSYRFKILDFESRGADLSSTKSKALISCAVTA